MTLLQRQPPGVHLRAIAIACMLWAITAAAQETPTAPPATTPATNSAPPPSNSQSQTGEKPSDDKNRQGQGQPTFNQDRLFGVLPNYATVENASQFKQLTVKDKYRLSWESMTDKVTFGFIGFQALIGQAEDSEPAYGQGFKGYARRYGTSYADAAIATTMTTSVFPSLLRQDPRYYVLGKGSIAHRTLYSVKCIFVTRSDSGRAEFNASEIAGNAVAAGLSNTYHPLGDRTFANTVSIWGTDVMWDTAGNVAKEFWPDIRRHFSHKPKS